MKAFEGYRVLDLTHVLAGPFCTYQLAVLGAEVIKIEPPGEPDMMRAEGGIESLNRRGMGALFQSQGANKRALSLDLKTEAGRAIFKRLAGGADVVVENYRAGVPVSRVRSLDETLADPQFAHRAVLQRAEGFEGFGDSARVPVSAATWAEDGPELRSPPPAHGQHTDTILAELGFSADDVASLRERGVV